MKSLLPLALVVCVGPALAQSSISEAKCQTWENVMKGQTIPFRQQGIPVGVSEKSYNSEDDVRTRVFLKKTVQMIYGDLAKGTRYVESGAFLKECVKTHRGF